MNYKKLSSLLVASLVVLLVITFVMICTWFYFYFRSETREAAHTKTNKELPLNQNRRDSLERVYTATVNDLNTPIDSVWNRPDTLASLDNKLVEFYRLRNEISSLLQYSTSNKDLDSAREKIAMLQQRIEELRNRTMMVEYENKRLNEIVKQLGNRLLRSAQTARRDAAAHNVTERISVANDATAAGPRLTATGFTMMALKVEDGKEQETADPLSAEKLTGSFVVTNLNESASGLELLVVITGPDGKVLKGSAWESGSFDTDKGKRIYSCKVVVDLAKGDNKRVYFTLTTDDLQQGNYKVQVYYKGDLIGRSGRTF